MTTVGQCLNEAASVENVSISSSADLIMVILKEDRFTGNLPLLQMVWGPASVSPLCLLGWKISGSAPDLLTYNRICILIGPGVINLHTKVWDAVVFKTVRNSTRNHNKAASQYWFGNKSR